MDEAEVKRNFLGKRSDEMNKNMHAGVSTLVLCAGLVAGSASAVSLSPKGIGQVLVYP